MILLLDTSTAVCRVTVVKNGKKADKSWEAGRELSKGLLAYIRDCLAEEGGDFQSLTGIGVMKGPGSFTGLRIGLTVANTLADSLKVPIVGQNDDNWQDAAMARLENGENDQLVMPFYGSEANITQPRK